MQGGVYLFSPPKRETNFAVLVPGSRCTDRTASVLSSQRVHQRHRNPPERRGSSPPRHWTSLQRCLFLGRFRLRDNGFVGTRSSYARAALAARPELVHGLQIRCLHCARRRVAAHDLRAGVQRAPECPHDEAMTQGQAGYIWCAHLATALRARPTRAAARPMQAFKAVHEHVLRAEVPL